MVHPSHILPARLLWAQSHFPAKSNIEYGILIQCHSSNCSQLLQSPTISLSWLTLKRCTASCVIQMGSTAICRATRKRDSPFTPRAVVRAADGSGAPKAEEESLSRARCKKGAVIAWTDSNRTWERGIDRFLGFFPLAWCILPIRSMCLEKAWELYFALKEIFLFPFGRFLLMMNKDETKRRMN